MGLDVGEQRLLAQVVADHVGHVGVDALVVGDAGAGRVGDGDVAEPVGVEEAGGAELRIGAEGQGVDEVVVDAAVDHVHLLQARGRAHVDEAVVDHEVAALHQLHAHLLGEEHVLVEGGVVDAGSEQDDAGVRDAGRRELGQRLAQQPAVVLDPAHPVTAEEVAQAGLQRAPVGQHVGDARRHPQVVLQHHEAVVGAYDIGAAERHVDAVGHLEAPHLDPVLRAAPHQVHRHDPVLENPPRPVDIGEEAVERFQALAQAALDQVPVGGVHEPGQEVDGDDPLLRPVLAVDRERDPLVQEGALGVLLHGGDLGGAHPVERLAERVAVGARHAGGLEHLVVEGRAGLVGREQALPGPCRAVAFGYRLSTQRFATHASRAQSIRPGMIVVWNRGDSQAWRWCGASEVRAISP